MNSNKSSSGATGELQTLCAGAQEISEGALGACVIDERGAEVPITEQDIRQSLDSLHQDWERERARREAVTVD